MSKGSSDYAGGCVGLVQYSHAEGEATRSVNIQLRLLVKAGPRRLSIKKKKCKTRFSQENPRHSSLNPQEGWTRFLNHNTCEVPRKRTEWDHMPSFLQVRPVLWSGTVATFHRAYHGRSDVKL